MLRIMKGLRAFGPFAIGAALATGGLLMPQMAFAIGVPKLQADSSSYAAIWFLGPAAISNVTGYGGNVYYTSITAYATAPPGDDNPHPVITYQTNQPSIISLTPNGASVLITAIGPSYTTKQSQPVYKVTVTVTCGTAISPLQSTYSSTFLFSNSVVLMKASIAHRRGLATATRASSRARPAWYITLLDVYVKDLFSNTLVQVPANETLKDPLYLGTGGWTSSLGVLHRGSGPLTYGIASTHSPTITRG